MKRMIFATFVLCLFTALTFAQSTTGRLIGTVSGPDGLLPGATVVVTDNQTNRELTATTGDDGGYKFEQLSFGTYTVRVTAAGFTTFVATDVKIDANRDYSLNSTLQVGGQETVVTVQAGADILNATDAALVTTISPRQVLELPINGRNPLSLLNLQAGVNSTSNSINGQRSSSQNYTRDGVNVQDNFIRTGGFVQDQPTVDDTGEFSVVTQNAGAELGGGGSTQVLLVTPRGGSEFHGAAWEYNRNSLFSANEFGLNATNVEKPFLNRNQFGGKLSGPLPLPGFGEGTPVFFKDKGFFFAQYERFELRQTFGASRRILLNQFRNGNFTYVDNAGVTRTVNVLTGAGLTGPIPAAAGGALTVDPTITRRFLSLSPTVGNGPTQSLSSAGPLTQTFIFNQSDNRTRNGFTTRFDVDFNDRNSVYFVYKYNDDADDRPDADGGGFGLQPFVIQGGPTQLFIGSYRTVVGSNFVNEVRGAFNRSEPFFNESPGFATDFRIGGLPFGLSNPEASFQDQGRMTKQYTFQDNATYTVGNHSLRFGIDYNAQRIASQTNFNRVPVLNISTTGNLQTTRLATSLFPGGISGADRALADSLRFLLGGVIGSGTVAANFVNPSSGPQIGASSLQRLNYNTTGLYIADQWRATPNLTLNLGLRYDYFSPLTNPDQVYLEPDLMGAEGFDAIRAAVLNPNGRYVLVGTNSGTPGQFFKPDRNNFGPNVSFAYTPNIKGFLGSLFGKENQTVIRGGFRMGYVNDEYVRSSDNAAGGNPGLNSTIFANNAPSINGRLSNPPTFALPAFNAPPNTFREQNAVTANNFNTAFVIDPNLQAQRNMEYNFGIQREIGFNTAVEIRYVGGRSNSLVRGTDVNQVDITSNGFLTDFLRARNNCRIEAMSRGETLADGCNSVGNTGLPGQVNLPVFAMLAGGGLLTNPTITGTVAAGNAADLATIYFTNRLNGSLPFRANPFIGPGDILSNGGRYRYNALQAEIRRRFTQGLSFQANYTFQKTLTDIQGDQQTRFDPILDNAQPNLEYARADYDRTHTVNINALYELPFGKGKRFLNSGGLSNAIFGGFQLTSIFNISSGVPLSIRDVNGTLNRIARSGRQTAVSNLTADEIKDLLGIFKVNGVVYFINPSVIAPSGSSGAGSATGNNVEGLGSAPGFAGQVFFRAQPGQTGNLPRNAFNGPMYFNWDAGIIKNIAFNERVRVQLRAEAFNVLNNVNFFIGESSNVFDIDSSTFGQIPLTSTYDPRILQFAIRFEF
ncbi:MAG: TonB-dependent receptor [Acidobacteriota bacterium]|nr:TonB-dependent receptor [Acidobacteriota bacterium]